MQKETIAVFDFDGTITYGDSLFPFLFFTHGYKALFKLAYLSPWIAAYLLNLRFRQETKEKVLTAFYQNADMGELRKWGREYALHKLDAAVRPEAKERIRWHKSLNHRCILISASLDIYLEAWAKQAGFDDLICSIPAVDEHNHFTGKILGLNCWGQEKVKRLKEMIGDPKQYVIYAYGDSPGDKPLLQIADYPFYRALS